jgi:hypothetical protein
MPLLLARRRWDSARDLVDLDDIEATAAWNSAVLFTGMVQYQYESLLILQLLEKK